MHQTYLFIVLIVLVVLTNESTRSLLSVVPTASTIEIKSSSLPLHEKSPYSEFYWSVFSRNRTEYREYSQYLVRMREIRTRKTLDRDTFHLMSYCRVHQLISCHWSLYIPPENIRKLLVNRTDWRIWFLI